MTWQKRRIRWKIKQIAMREESRREREVRRKKSKRRILGIMDRRHMMEMEERKGI